MSPEARYFLYNFNISESGFVKAHYLQELSGPRLSPSLLDKLSRSNSGRVLPAVYGARFEHRLFYERVPNPLADGRSSVLADGLGYHPGVLMTLVDHLLPRMRLEDARAYEALVRAPLIGFAPVVHQETAIRHPRRTPSPVSARLQHPPGEQLEFLGLDGAR